VQTGDKTGTGGGGESVYGGSYLIIMPLLTNDDDQVPSRTFRGRNPSPATFRTPGAGRYGQ
jgi:hypothetical protein